MTEQGPSPEIGPSITPGLAVFPPPFCFMWMMPASRVDFELFKGAENFGFWILSASGGAGGVSLPNWTAFFSDNQFEILALPAHPPITVRTRRKTTMADFDPVISGQ